MSLTYIRASIDGGFWQGFRELVREKTIPYQWMALNDQIPGAPRSHSIENFRIAANRAAGQYDGMVFQDSDLFKWLEAAGHILADPSPLNARIMVWTEQAIELIGAAQQPDGYLNTYFTVKDPGRRWKNLREAHELYCAGHFIEAAVAVHRSTGNAKILEIARRLADHIDARFGVGPGKVRGYCGHEEVELALVKLFRVTGERRYLDLARFFVDERGREPNFFEREAEAPDFVPLWGIHDLGYYQARVPVRRLPAAEGHAVRAMYLCTAMADLALETGDHDIGRACDRLWEGATGRRMYVTGGIGSSARNEAFSADFDLPNDTAYAETCAAIGLFVFSHRMVNLRNDARYADVMERALYNGVISGLALDGQHYFYVNPLSVRPDVCDENPSYKFVKYRRQAWYGCACCPPNIARILASLGEYVYHFHDGTLYADIYHEGSLSFEVEGRRAAFRQRTRYPWEETVSFECVSEAPAAFDFAVRLPGWCRKPSLRLNGAKVDPGRDRGDGYAHLRRDWRAGDRLELVLPMPVERVRSDPRVSADYGRVAIQRGPLVYCLEQEDNGGNLHVAEIPPGARLDAESAPDLLGGIVVVKGRGRAWSDGAIAEELYSRNGKPTTVGEKVLRFIPYYAWANRQPGEMTVWVRE